MPGDILTLVRREQRWNVLKNIIVRHAVINPLVDGSSCQNDL